MKLVAALLGVLAIGGPILLFNIWLKTQGHDESPVVAERALAAIEAQLGETVAMLQSLSARGADTCQPAHLEAMRQAALRTGAVKDVALVSPGGQTVCGDSASFRTELVRSWSTAKSPDLMFDLVRTPDRATHYLRVRKKGAAGKPALAALLPVSALAPKAWSSDLLVTIPGGLPIDGRSAGQPEPGEPSRHSVRSQQYALTVAATVPRPGSVAEREDLQRLGMVGSGVVAIILLFAALLVSRRKADASLADIGKAILANEFEPYYQPVVDLRSGRLLGAEVLARWKRADGSVVEPNAFISLMETSGLMPEMTRALMKRVRQDVGTAVGARPAMTLAFNVAAQHFDDGLILHDVGTIFDGSPIKLSQIGLELTERQEIQNLDRARRTIAALQGLGCKIAIDDVGTGHNGLSYILKLGVDVIKIDRMFVEAIAAEGHSRAIIETLIDLAKNMRMDIVAEGVETFDQVSYLRDRGITAAQGYVFAPPLPASSFLTLLQAMDPADAATTVRPVQATAPRKQAAR